MWTGNVQQLLKKAQLEMQMKKITVLMLIMLLISYAYGLTSNGLVSCYDIDGNLNDDCSSFNLAGTEDYVAGKSGQATFMDANAQQIGNNDAGFPMNIPASGTFTINYWINISNCPGTDDRQSMFQNGGSGKLYFGVLMDASCSIQSYVYEDGGDSDIGTNTANLATAVYHMVTLRYSNGNITLWVDSARNYTGGLSSSETAGATDFDFFTQNDLDWSIDEVTIWNISLNDANVSELWNESNGHFYPFTEEGGGAPPEEQQLWNITCFGDSITAGWENVSASETYCGLLGMSDNITTHNYGVGGDTSAELYARMSDVIGKGYNSTIVMIGINDANVLGGEYISYEDYYQNLLDIVYTLKADDQEVHLLDITPVGCQVNTSYNQTCDTQTQIIARNNVVRKVSEQMDVCYIPIFSSSFNDMFNETLFQDGGTHPNEEGHMEINRTIWSRIFDCTPHVCSGYQDCYNETPGKSVWITRDGYTTTENSIWLNWTRVNETYNLIYLDGVEVYNGSNTSWEFGSLTSNTAYLVNVTAVYNETLTASFQETFITNMTSSEQLNYDVERIADAMETINEAIEMIPFILVWIFINFGAFFLLHKGQLIAGWITYFFASFFDLLLSGYFVSKYVDFSTTSGYYAITVSMFLAACSVWIIFRIMLPFTYRTTRR